METSSATQRIFLDNNIEHAFLRLLTLRSAASSRATGAARDARLGLLDFWVAGSNPELNAVELLAACGYDHPVSPIQSTSLAAFVALEGFLHWLQD